MPGQFCVIAPDVKLGRDVLIYHYVNLYGCDSCGQSCENNPGFSLRNLLLGSLNLSFPHSRVSDMEVPFVDLKAQYRSIKSEIDAAIARVIENTSFVLGREVENFEEQFAAYVGAKYCV